MIPTSRHNEPEVIEAKIEELNKYKAFGAFDIVEDQGQEAIDTRWVITEKEQQDGLKVAVKARIVLRGYKERNVPRSDSPTAAKELLKTTLAIAANEKWKLESLDVKAAFLELLGDDAANVVDDVNISGNTIMLKCPSKKDGQRMRNTHKDKKLFNCAVTWKFESEA